jgi:hypothetical protein
LSFHARTCFDKTSSRRRRCHNGIRRFPRNCDCFRLCANLRFPFPQQLAFEVRNFVPTSHCATRVLQAIVLQAIAESMRASSSVKLSNRTSSDPGQLCAIAIVECVAVSRLAHLSIAAHDDACACHSGERAVELNLQLQSTAASGPAAAIRHLGVFVAVWPLP